MRSAERKPSSGQAARSPSLAPQLEREGRLIAEAAATPETQAAIQAFLTRGT